MSRIGKKPVLVPAGVTVAVDNTTVTVKGPKGELTRALRPEMIIKQEGNTITVDRPNDSKQLTPKKREALYDEIMAKAVAVGVGMANEKVIDEINVLNADYEAMKQAISKLQVKPQLLLQPLQGLQAGLFQPHLYRIYIPYQHIFSQIQTFYGCGLFPFQERRSFSERIL